MATRFFLLVALALLTLPQSSHAETLKIASPQRGSWEGAIPELGMLQGIFQKHGLDLDIVYTSGGGETMQIVIGGAVDVGLSAGTSSAFGAYAKGAPVRIIAASSTGSQELFWYVPTKSPIQNIREANNTTLAYSTTGASTHIAVMRFIRDYNLKANPVATGNPAATFTQTMSGQVDIGWAVAPFALDALNQGQVRVVGRASDIAAIREQTIRLQIVNTKTFAEKKDALVRYMRAYRETVDWMYASPDAVPRYMAFSGFSEGAVRRMLKDFIPKESLQTSEIRGIKEGMDDAVQFKFLAAPLSEQQLKELIQILPN
jgi:ABC-type nitrate/sulfonate/bicarbonate transport system substrate-binding protein